MSHGSLCHKVADSPLQVAEVLPGRRAATRSLDPKGRINIYKFQLKIRLKIRLNHQPDLRIQSWFSFICALQFHCPVYVTFISRHQCNDISQIILYVLFLSPILSSSSSLISTSIWSSPLRRSATILPPALPDSIGIKNCYGCYSGEWTFLDKSKFDFTVSINWDSICFCPETSNPLSNDYNSFWYRTWYAIRVSLHLKSDRKFVHMTINSTLTQIAIFLSLCHLIRKFNIALGRQNVAS